MRAVVSSLTVAILLAHGIVGCCWHHAHACGRSHDPFSWRSSVHHSEAIEEHAGDDCDHADAEHPVQDDCQGGRCVFLVSTVQKASQPLVSIARVDLLPAGREAQADAAGITRPNNVNTGLRLLPIRLHLVNQVLLI